MSTNYNYADNFGLVLLSKEEIEKLKTKEELRKVWNKTFDIIAADSENIQYIKNFLFQFSLCNANTKSYDNFATELIKEASSINQLRNNNSNNDNNNIISNNNNLISLPFDLLISIVSKLDIVSFINVSLCNRLLYRTTLKNGAFHNEYYKIRNLSTRILKTLSKRVNKTRLYDNIKYVKITIPRLLSEYSDIGRFICNECDVPGKYSTFSFSNLFKQASKIELWTSTCGRVHPTVLGYFENLQYLVLKNCTLAKEYIKQYREHKKQLHIGFLTPATAVYRYNQGRMEKLIDTVKELKALNVKTLTIGDFFPFQMTTELDHFEFLQGLKIKAFEPQQYSMSYWLLNRHFATLQFLSIEYMLRSCKCDESLSYDHTVLEFLKELQVKIDIYCPCDDLYNLFSLQFVNLRTLSLIVDIDLDSGSRLDIWLDNNINIFNKRLRLLKILFCFDNTRYEWLERKDKSREALDILVAFFKNNKSKIKVPQYLVIVIQTSKRWSKKLVHSFNLTINSFERQYFDPLKALGTNNIIVIYLDKRLIDFYFHENESSVSLDDDDKKSDFKQDENIKQLNNKNKCNMEVSLKELNELFIFDFHTNYSLLQCYKYDRMVITSKQQTMTKICIDTQHEKELIQIRKDIFKVEAPVAYPYNR